MKLRNKKTGDIKDFALVIANSDVEDTTLAELCEEWEDYEEPKEHWAIDQFGEPINVSGLSRLQIEKLHRIGNDFPSENATMKAIEKLKAWQRLKDKGFGFGGYTRNQTGTYEILLKREIPYSYYDNMEKDLDLLFGGEE